MGLVSNFLRVNRLLGVFSSFFGFNLSWSPTVQAFEPGESIVRSDNFLVPVQWDAQGIRAAFHGESEQPQYGATKLFSPCTVFLCLHTSGCEAYSFTTAGHGILNVRTTASDT